MHNICSILHIGWCIICVVNIAYTHRPVHNMCSIPRIGWYTIHVVNIAYLCPALPHMTATLLSFKALLVQWLKLMNIYVKVLGSIPECAHFTISFLGTSNIGMQYCFAQAGHSNIAVGRWYICFRNIASSRLRFTPAGGLSSQEQYCFGHRPVASYP